LTKIKSELDARPGIGDRMQKFDWPTITSLVWTACVTAGLLYVILLMM
jgi:hypothetical protein